ncbi:hypothetical protein ITJ86_05070 [Winogradskyella sp. F6397]|uniref:Uncharacterized protein n=1 Tax=Winogradskyella marina TaxID=2785530 RepID=A0ABS0EFM9_9FLAO|nr:hypothetical protein [Winogradskyella marina]MBF8149255.1 hypothetical protein [Winogradskyella marina]
MKTIYSLLLVILLVSCKNESPKESTTGTENPMNEELTNSRNYKSSGNFENETYTFKKKTDSIDENWNLDSPERQMSLYERFQMDDSQQEQYETALAEWSNTNPEEPYKKLSTATRIEAESNILKQILSEDQFKHYELWVNEND